MNATGQAARHSIKIDGVRWAYTERGAGPLVVFMHGLLATSAMFDELIDSLADRYRCVAVDWPGHGRSGFDPAGWTVEDLLCGVIHLLDQLEASTASLVGLSQGAAASLRVALRNPDRVDALVMMSAGAGDAPPALVKEFIELSRILRSASSDERRRVLGRLQHRLHRPGWVDRNPAAAQREFAEMLTHDPQGIALAMQVPASFGSVEDLLPTLQCPTLVLCGAKDANAPLALAMADMISDARAVMLPGAGHHITHDSTETCVKEVGTFLDQAHGRKPHTTVGRGRNA